jgi:hypothetical protein
LFNAAYVRQCSMVIGHNPTTRIELGASYA